MHTQFELLLKTYKDILYNLNIGYELKTKEINELWSLIMLNDLCKNDNLSNKDLIKIRSYYGTNFTN